MKILIWASSFGQILGGGPVLAPLLAGSLAARRHELTVFVDDRHCCVAHDEHIDDVRVLRLPFQAALRGDRALLREVLLRVARARSEFTSDIEFVFSTSASSIFRDATQGRHRPALVAGLHDFHPAERFAETAAVGRTLRQADWVIGCSQAVISEARSFLPEIANRSSAIVNALPDWPAGTAAASPADARVVFLGRLVEKKGAHVLLAAVAQLAEAFPALRLHIGGDGDQLAPLKQQVSALNLDARVTFLGPVARGDVPGILAGSVMTVVPSLEEPFGLVALEAALAGRPVIASHVGGLSEIVRDGVTGLLVAPGDAPALASAIGALLRAPERAADLGRAARSHALRQFSWNDFVDAHESLFHRLAACG